MDECRLFPERWFHRFGLSAVFSNLFTYFSGGKQKRIQSSFILRDIFRLTRNVQKLFYLLLAIYSLLASHRPQLFIITFGKFVHATTSSAHHISGQGCFAQSACIGDSSFQIFTRSCQGIPVWFCGEISIRFSTEPTQALKPQKSWIPFSLDTIRWGTAQSDYSQPEAARRNLRSINRSGGHTAPSLSGRISFFFWIVGFHPV